MSDLQRYTNQRARHDKIFAQTFEAGYFEFKPGTVLRQAREKASLAHEDLARRLHIGTSNIIRIENHPGAVCLSTLRRDAEAVGIRLQIDLEQH